VKPERRSAHGRQRAPAAALDLLLDAGHDALGLLFMPVRQQPARALGNRPAQHQDQQAQRRADAESEPPAQIGREPRRIEQQHGRPGA
jgi:hypothetical protein